VGVLLVLLMFAGDVVSVPASGQASYYGRGVMEGVYANRLVLGDVDPCGDCVDFVAMRLRSDVGRRVVIRYAGVVYGPFLVVDCAAPRDLGLMVARRRVVEVSWEQAAAWGMVGPVEVELMPSANGGSGAADSRAALLFGGY
jgi:hypothetical protein